MRSLPEEARKLLRQPPSVWAHSDYLEMAIWARHPTSDHPRVHHSDRGRAAPCDSLHEALAEERRITSWIHTVTAMTTIGGDGDGPLNPGDSESLLPKWLKAASPVVPGGLNVASTRFS